MGLMGASFSVHFTNILLHNIIAPFPAQNTYIYSRKTKQVKEAPWYTSKYRFFVNIYQKLNPLNSNFYKRGGVASIY